jgi:hypothetical protein
MLVTCPWTQGYRRVIFPHQSEGLAGNRTLANSVTSSGANRSAIQYDYASSIAGYT